MTAVADKLIEEMRAWRGEAWRTEVFEDLAREVFSFQFETIQPDRYFCELRGVSPATLRNCREIPAVPTDVFKRVELVTSGSIERTFLTSGTNGLERGAHHFPSLEIYRASLREPFRRHCVPSSLTRQFHFLAPAPADVPESSLSFMLGEILEEFGVGQEDAFWMRRDVGGAWSLDAEGLIDTLERARGPVVLIGTAFAFVEFFDGAAHLPRLPDGSVIMETGGLKGRARHIEREDLFSLFNERLGVRLERCVSEYSMTELSSQAYTDNLVRGVPWHDASYQVPPWVQVDVVDPVDFSVLPAGERGLIRWLDLANLYQTSDVGVSLPDGGFQLFGRADGAERRGCSLLVEEIVAGQSDALHPEKSKTKGEPE